ncbi:ABC transporter ATP-binding protein [Dietzia sp. JS16-p6b]|nr:ABC transporter ATP-binding protein [Dietzia sp. JS16-p6b]
MTTQVPTTPQIAATSRPPTRARATNAVLNGSRIRDTRPYTICNDIRYQQGVQTMPLSGPALSAHGLCYGYEGREVLHDAAVEMAYGTVTAFAGPNGSGKSTLVELLAGVRVPLRGEVRRRGTVSLVVQRPAAPEALPLTVRDTVSMGTWGRRIGRREAREVVAEMIGAVGLDGLESRSLTELSGGQRQRALLAQALASRADIVLMDEPDAGLDSASRRHVHELLTDQARRRGVAVGCASHDERFVATADHVVRLEAGHVTSCATYTPDTASAATPSPVRSPSSGMRGCSSTPR